MYPTLFTKYYFLFPVLSTFQGPNITHYTHIQLVLYFPFESILLPRNLPSLPLSLLDGRSCIALARLVFSLRQFSTRTYRARILCYVDRHIRFPRCSHPEERRLEAPSLHNIIDYRDRKIAVGERAEVVFTGVAVKGLRIWLSSYPGRTV